MTNNKHFKLKRYLVRYFDLNNEFEFKFNGFDLIIVDCFFFGNDTKNKADCREFWHMAYWKKHLGFMKKVSLYFDPLNQKYIYNH
jgi:hypothetical protein